MPLPRRPELLACALLAMSAAAAIVPLNESSEIASFRGEIQLQDANTNTNMTELVPLSREAVMSNRFPLQGNLWLTTDASVGNLSSEDIPYISCDQEDYTGNIDATGVFQTAYENENITAVILYSTRSSYCNYTDMPSNLVAFPIFSMTSSQSSQTVLNRIDELTIASKFFVNIGLFASGETDINNIGDRDNQPGQNPLGPSPSTAVAMIILYSITGIITALFLVIIITGAVRAHRHPERYGPRNVLGRPRQSRARGLGRAILDTIPIVKFGEREPRKPTDVELGSTAEARDANDTNATATETGAQDRNEQDPSRTEMTSATPEPTTSTVQTAVADQPSGIAPAQVLAVGAASSGQNAEEEESLGCSICTDDFEMGQDIRVLPCNHKFHCECVDPWLLNVSGTCPLCRVDLRPTTSHTADEQDLDQEELTAPIPGQDEASHRRRNALREMLSLRSQPNASPEERISALRRLREARRNHSGDVASGSANGSTEDVAAHSRRNRISARLSNVFSGRTRGAGMGREESPASTQRRDAASSNLDLPATNPTTGPGNSSTDLPGQVPNQRS